MYISFSPFLLAACCILCLQANAAPAPKAIPSPTPSAHSDDVVQKIKPDSTLNPILAAGGMVTPTGAVVPNAQKANSAPAASEADSDSPSAPLTPRGVASFRSLSEFVVGPADVIVEDFGSKLSGPRKRDTSAIQGKDALASRSVVIENSSPEHPPSNPVDGPKLHPRGKAVKNWIDPNSWKPTGVVPELDLKYPGHKRIYSDGLPKDNGVWEGFADSISSMDWHEEYEKRRKAREKQRSIEAEARRQQRKKEKDGPGPTTKAPPAQPAPPAAPEAKKPSPQPPFKNTTQPVNATKPQTRALKVRAEPVKLPVSEDSLTEPSKSKAAPSPEKVDTSSEKKTGPINSQDSKEKDAAHPIRCLPKDRQRKNRLHSRQLIPYLQGEEGRIWP